jgi:hypothetical protein
MTTTYNALLEFAKTYRDRRESPQETERLLLAIAFRQKLPPSEAMRAVKQAWRNGKRKFKHKLAGREPRLGRKDWSGWGPPLPSGYWVQLPKLVFGSWRHKRLSLHARTILTYLRLSRTITSTPSMAI